MSESGARNVLDLDHAHVVHHMAPLRDRSEPPAIMVRGEGLRLWDSSGREYLDAVSGMFNVNIGYGRSEIADAVAADLARLGFAPLFNDLGNAPAAHLAAALARVGPRGIDRFFFTVGGSDAVDTALKFARAYHARRGEPDRSVVLSRRGSYHGMSYGALSVTGQSRYWDTFGPMLPGSTLFGQPADEDGTPDAVDHLIESIGPERVAAVLIEPISLTAGVSCPPSDYLRSLRAVADRHGALLIVDEVVTGFGRTGAMFFLQHDNVAPDLLVLAKGITSGYLPLGAVGMSDAVHQTIVRRDEPLLNGFSAGGHPSACVAALTNLEIIEREVLVERARTQGRYLGKLLDELARSDDDVTGWRGEGMMAAVDVGDELAAGIADRLRSQGMLVRRYGPAIALGPSLVASQADLEEIVTRLAHAVDEARRATVAR